MAGCDVLDNLAEHMILNAALGVGAGAFTDYVIQASMPTPSATSPFWWFKDPGSGAQKLYVRLRKSSGPDVYSYYPIVGA